MKNTDLQDLRNVNIMFYLWIPACYYNMHLGSRWPGNNVNIETFVGSLKQRLPLAYISFHGIGKSLHSHVHSTKDL
jgi:hypothetical protein